MQIYTEAGARGWSLARLIQAWRDLDAAITRAGWKTIEDLPRLYRHNADIVTAELRRRGDQLALFD